MPAIASASRSRRAVFTEISNSPASSAAVTRPRACSTSSVATRRSARMGASVAVELDNTWPLLAPRAILAVRWARDRARMSAVTSADEPAPAPPVDYDRLGEAELRARRTHKWHAFAPDVLPMELAELDVPTAPCVVEAVRRGVDGECFADPMFADRGLAEAKASFCTRRYGWAADPGWVHDFPELLRGLEIDL